MPIDLKYGRVTLENQRNVGDDEPVFVFRAQDALLPAVLAFYLKACRNNGSPTRHTTAVEHALDRVITWQEIHPTKIPTSNGLGEA